MAITTTTTIGQAIIELEKELADLERRAGVIQEALYHLRRAQKERTKKS